MEIESTYCTNMATVAVNVAEQAKPLDGPSVTLTIRLIMQGKVCHPICLICLILFSLKSYLYLNNSFVCRLL